MKWFAVRTGKKRKNILQLSACSLHSNKTRSILGTAVSGKSRLDWLGVPMIVLLCEQHWGAGFDDTLQDIRTITDFCFHRKVKQNENFTNHSYFNASTSAFWKSTILCWNWDQRIKSYHTESRVKMTHELMDSTVQDAARGETAFSWHLLWPENQSIKVWITQSSSE